MPNSRSNVKKSATAAHDNDDNEVSNDDFNP